jgi:hypothetical protein
MASSVISERSEMDASTEVQSFAKKLGRSHTMSHLTHGSQLNRPALKSHDIFEGLMNADQAPAGHAL